MVAKLDNQEEPMRENLEQIEDSEAEECLSFCDLPIYDRATSTTTNGGGNDDDRRRSSTDQELFEFFCDLRADMYPADGIIFCGKLIPYREKECQSEKDGNQISKIKSFFRRRRRSESLDELQRSPSSAKHHSSSSSSSSSSSLARPKLPWLMFGMVKLQKKMELKDIKNRQNRQNPTSLLPAFAGSGVEKVKVRREEEKRSWRLLRALSCGGHASAAAVSQ
ncbi:hypothetical protein NE237_025130 [Protea cynaroides]|uniref:Uncharacterized protein n=1 Tax=Protea cynaroides TaxID=273540 RepID=A0A9Q0H2J0_9MAGN|nr:hypothetical protein NE237_025130 [Protea cynaroides]